MNHEQRLISLVESAISGSLEEIAPKLDFWGIKNPIRGGTLWQQPESLGEKNLPSLLESIDLQKLNSDQRTLLGIGWELVWGQSAPENVVTLRDQLLRKVANSQDLTNLEKLWYGLICVDTDSF